MLHSLLQPSAVASSLDEPRKWAEMQALNVIPTEFISDESVHVRVELGPTSECILNAAKQIAPTMIVMGAKGYGPVENYFYGTTVDRVLRHAIQPVLTLTI
jgi:nucleotide-binding universal stress UspA family protein